MYALGKTEVHKGGGPNALDKERPLYTIQIQIYSILSTVPLRGERLYLYKLNIRHFKRYNSIVNRKLSLKAMVQRSQELLDPKGESNKQNSLI